MQFSRLRISGFKSFVDPTELVIEPGLTGIVGPNGCGKSNLVEALRWVMGENSAKKMRGDGMDDVIFGGTATRPARNLAEVALSLSNDGDDTVAAFPPGADIEVVRRIDRGAGSAFKINGKEARARDVQLMFADASSGARSTALVSQGHIGEIISAKPVQRRHLLEEAAGITGLHSRRHEAELRLRAAETNLERLDDVLGTLRAQHQALKRQARQAARYRSLNDRIRKAEAATLYHRWSAAREAAIEAESRDGAAAQTLAEAGRQAAAAATAQAEAAAGLPDLRDAAAAATAAFHRVELTLERLEDESRRIAEEIETLETQAAEIERDREREATLHQETVAAIERLDAERQALDRARAEEEATLAGAAEQRETCQHAVEALEQAVAKAADEAAAIQARRAALDRGLTELDARLTQLAERRAAAVAEKDQIEAKLAASAALTEARAAVGEAETAAREAHESLDTRLTASAAADKARATAEVELQAAREALQAAESDAARVQAEIDGLAALVAPSEASADAPAGEPVVDRVTVEAGWETALGAALGDDLTASLDESDPRHWRRLDGETNGAPLPGSVTPLSEHVSAPPALARRLAQVGIVDAERGAALQADLAPGQRLVSRDGTLWRWDGLVRVGDAPSAEAVRLSQRNRLGALREKLDGLVPNLLDARSAVSTARTALDAATEARSTAQTAEGAARAEARQADSTLNTARKTLADAEAALGRDRARLTALADAVERLDADRDEAVAAASAAVAERDGLPDADALRAPLDAQREALGEKRRALEDAVREHERQLAAARVRQERLGAIEQETGTWRTRAEDAERQIESLTGRRDALTKRRTALADRPTAIEAERRGLLDRMTQVSADRDTAADSLAAAEAVANEREATLRAANESLAQAREDKARVEGQLDQARTLLEVEEGRIRERLDSTAQALLEIAEARDADDLPTLEDSERRLERLLRERETLGAVNLRADIEAQELSQQIGDMESEREDLIAAIAKLRGAIASLNREGRERLLKAFDEVNEHFQKLFERLFGGGRAHLDMVGDDDPLLAGLEIMASPPGKRLQSLSLLSGGEKALAALSLLFAVFLTKPAPVCVLDEVDAPLDDANVDRFCDLVEGIARDCQTRFLIVTHHRLTMARVHRLFGVTMSEPGVSQLVSVDLGAPVHLEAAE